MILENELLVNFSLQVSHLEDISGDFESETPFLVNNITDSTVEANVIPASDSAPIMTPLAPGWNPIICKGIVGAPADTFQIGY